MRSAAIAAVMVALAVPAAAARPADRPDASACGPASAPLVITGTVDPADEKTYRYVPITVPKGTERLDVAYSWVANSGAPTNPFVKTVLDLGLWDADPAAGDDGFRGWSGSRQPAVFVQTDAATRGYHPGRVRGGTWWVELGIASVAPGGATWQVTAACGPAAAEPVRPTRRLRDHVASPLAGWYHGDFHMHAYHSHRDGPDWDAFVAQAVAAGLDFLPVTEYTTDAHWPELGPVQARHPDLLVWPGREVITYFGHANVLGETPGLVEYRHGFGDITLGGIQRDAKAAGALFQVNHPTIFPGPAFAQFCRGCEFTLGDDIDWDAVDAIEVVTGPVLSDPSDIGGPSTAPLAAEQPFVDSAIELWERLLSEGHRIAPVSGSDSKGVEGSEAGRNRKGYGSSATAVYAEELSIDGLRDAIAAGRVYVRTRGVDESPALELLATNAAGEAVTFGGTLADDDARLRVTVSGGAGELLRFIVNGTPHLTVPIAQDHQVVEIPVFRAPATEGPLGTFWRVETLDARSRTTIGNAVFLHG